jgi:glycosyltransferase involved in cell wall biosynthesis
MARSRRNFAVDRPAIPEPNLPLVSVIIPSFNHESFIEQCLNSILADEYQNKEILVLDDGSTDGTLHVIQSWASRNGGAISINVWSHSNRGATRSLNELLGRAGGRYVLPIASDDYLLPHAITTLVAAIEGAPEFNAVFGDCIVVNEAGELLHESSLFGYRRANRVWLVRRLADELITNWAVAGPALLYRREPILAIGGYSEDLFVEDWDFYLRLVMRRWLRFVDHKVAAYRLHDRNEHRNAENFVRRADDQRRVALRAANGFKGRQRLLLRLQALSFSAPLVGPRDSNPTNVVRLGLRAGVRLVARLIASIG